MTIKMSQLFVLEPSQPSSLRHFIKFWAERYYAADESLYLNNIKGPHTPKSLAALFKWKIGNRFFRYAMPDLKKHFINRRDEAWKLVKKLAVCEPRDLASRFLDEFNEGGAIRRIFWLHCWCPKLPIYDQNVHRAMTFIKDNGEIEELPDLNADAQIQRYLDRYIQFFDEFRAFDSREVDMALFEFGRSMAP